MSDTNSVIPPTTRKLRALVITLDPPPSSSSSPTSNNRRQHIQNMFQHPSMVPYFDPPDFIMGIPSRSLNNRKGLFYHCHLAGLIPPEEWNVLKRYCDPKITTKVNNDGVDMFDTLRLEVPVVPKRRHYCHHEREKKMKSNGSRNKNKRDDNNINNTKNDKIEEVGIHYSIELWRKAKGLNRGRSVLACTLAHLIAMKHFVNANEKFDFILEDNVRCPIVDWSDEGRRRPVVAEGNDKTGIDKACDESSIRQDNKEEGSIPTAAIRCECARRIWETIRASEEAERENDTTYNNDTSSIKQEEKEEEEKKMGKCHLRYYGWLGSRPNLEWIFNVHIPRTAHNRQVQRKPSSHGDDIVTIFPFPTTEDIDQMDSFTPDNLSSPPPRDNNNDKSKTTSKTLQPGGTPIWGAYAYWISPQAYTSILTALQTDIGSLMWKGKRMRCHVAKPIDKILPRKVMARDGIIHVTNQPAFFRAPMLTSKIHTKFDGSFCVSTEYQMMMSGGGGCLVNGGRSLGWDDMWLSDDERLIVKHREESGVWITLDELQGLK